MTIPENAIVGQHAFDSCTGFSKLHLSDTTLRGIAAFHHCCGQVQAIYKPITSDATSTSSKSETHLASDITKLVDEYVRKTGGFLWFHSKNESLLNAMIISYDETAVYLTAGIMLDGKANVLFNNTRVRYDDPMMSLYFRHSDLVLYLLPDRLREN